MYCAEKGLGTLNMILCTLRIADTQLMKLTLGISSRRGMVTRDTN